MAEPELAGSPLITPGQKLERPEQDQLFLHWLSQLKGPQQRAVLALYYDDATTEEIAEILEMKPATVRSTLQTAREALRRIRQIDEDGGALSDLEHDGLPGGSQDPYHHDLGRTIERSLDVHAGLADATFTAMYSSLGANITRQVHVARGLEAALDRVRTESRPIAFSDGSPDRCRGSRR